MNPSDGNLRALYQSVILEHNRTPRNRGRLADETHRARGFNPLCGDDITVSLEIESDRIVDVGFEGKGCAICTAAASCMTEACKGHTTGELVALAEAFESMITNGETRASLADAGQLEAFRPVTGFPSRIKCAILPWRALVHALNGSEGVTTTEGV